MLTLAGYTITEAIRVGAGASLYRGIRLADQLKVAIKVLDQSSPPNAASIAQIRHEYAILRDLPLEGVVKALSLESVNERPALVLEDAGGTSLRDVLGAGKLELEKALRIAAQLAHILSEVHARGVVHKDIKPDNLLYKQETGKVTLCDFGIASRLSAEPQSAQSPASLEGTLAYLSPEQTGRMNRVVDHRSDLYSLGVTLYEMLTGLVPFRSPDPMDLVHSHIARSPAPPNLLFPEIPRTVSNIVQKLLAKAAEDRYQSARGLEADLEHCLSALMANQTIEPFALGRHDRQGELSLSQKLYGRDAEIGALVSAFDRVTEGDKELVLVEGYAGVGKSALVNELHKAITHKGGYFITGKSDQLSRSVPYAPVVSAFRELMRQLDGEPEERRAEWASSIKEAVGSNGRLVVDLVPELASLIGPQSELTELRPTEAQNRFELTIDAFVRVFCAAEHPLVLFLDDLHWADPASLKLLRHLLTDPESHHLLVIGAFRGTEVAEGHPLRFVIDEIRRKGTPAREILLSPLDEESVVTMLSDTLGASPELVRPLGALILEKTGGNPFFLHQILVALYEEGRIVFDKAVGAFVWDLEAIRATAIPDDVADFMTQKIRRLSPATQRALELAATLGYEFDLKSLSIICEKRSAQTAGDLWEALDEGLILPVEPTYRLMYADSAEGSFGVPSSRDIQISYRFMHDRVQQAAYSLIAADERPSVHLRIGRLLWKRLPQEPTDNALFDVVRHLDIGVALIDEREERRQIAELNQRAGRRAKARAAYQAAAGYFEAATALIDDEDELSFSLHAERAECEYLSGRFDVAEPLFNDLARRARSEMELSVLYNLRMVLYSSMGRFEAAAKVGLEALALFGVVLPEDEEERQARVALSLAEVQQNLKGRSLEELASAPEISDPREQAILRLLSNLTTPSYFIDNNLLALVIVEQVNRTLRFGPQEASAYGLMMFGMLSAGILGRYDQAQGFCQLALRLNERFQNADLICKLNHVYGACCHYWEPLQDGMKHLDKAISAGLEVGDLIYLSYACNNVITYRLALGDPLAEVSTHITRYLGLMQRTRDALSSAFLTIARQMVANLEGRTKSARSLSDEGFDEVSFAAHLEAAGLGFAACFYYTVKTMLAYLHGDCLGALEFSMEAERLLPRAVAAQFVTDLAFYTNLSIAAILYEVPASNRRAYIETMHRNEDKIASLAEYCPENYLHKHLLVLAERERLAGDDFSASELYDRAIEAARQNGFVRDEALANELCARMHLARRRRKIARVYMTDAYHGYLRWGALAKAYDIASAYPHLLIQHGSSSASSSVSTKRVPAEALDMGAVMRAAEAITSEIVLERVIDQLMRIVIATAGAQKGILLLEREGRSTIEATVTVDPDLVRIGPSVPLEPGAPLSVRLVQHVRRTREAVVLGDAARAGRFMADPYVVAERPKSILCLPMVQKGRLTGILYLENNIVADAFTPDRTEVLGLLSSQAAIAVENAMLYAHVKSVTEELKRSNEALAGERAHLEGEVASRTEELSKANERLTEELLERERAEEARAALQEEIIRVQNERLAEMSTPMIPITDRIVVMPLIGTLDEDRAQQALITALSGAAERRAAVVIIDITGVHNVDEQVAGTLLRAVGALRLLGTKVVLTGIRPEVATLLTRLEIDWTQIATKGTLQDGIAYAISRTGGVEAKLRATRR